MHVNARTLRRNAGEQQSVISGVRLRADTRRRREGTTCKPSIQSKQRRLASVSVSGVTAGEGQGVAPNHRPGLSSVSRQSSLASTDRRETIARAFTRCIADSRRATNWVEIIARLNIRIYSKATVTAIV